MNETACKHFAFRHRSNLACKGKINYVSDIFKVKKKNEELCKRMRENVVTALRTCAFSRKYVLKTVERNKDLKGRGELRFPMKTSWQRV